MKGLIFNIQRYSLHDGSGVRTIIFFKGCPLCCPWCSNPESQSFEIEEVRMPAKCLHCKTCSFNVEECPSGAMVRFGTFMTIKEVIDVVLKDMVFYRTTGGGVTLSGGEVLSQSEFAIELLKELKKLGIHTALETSGQGSTNALLSMANYLDVVLYDLKIMDNKFAKDILNSDTSLIEANLRALIKAGKKVIPRIPLVPGFTMTKANINSITDLVLLLDLKEVHLLPLHHYGSNKYEALNIPYQAKDIEVPTEQNILNIKAYLELKKLKVTIGG
ncbi:MAG: [formate-C-acetyltransferase]-activating enzyme [Firmicutes bacterium HGW-Firmicutes-1]|jgi:pyruvate formate lyase activating enzyme|nr:MAG: [formate-C-acetyltransferase]-activating enzyme [Firmicutes bacterium HGW-Firmicutes-1]